MEKSGKLYEAIQFYRRAVQLVPDIEFKLHEISKTKIKENSAVAESDDFKGNYVDLTSKTFILLLCY